MKQTARLLILLLVLLTACNIPFGYTEQQETGGEPPEEDASALPLEGMPETLPGWEEPPQTPAADGALNIPLRVNNPFDDRPVNAPVTTGVPLPKSLNLSDPGSLMLIDANGEPIPAQFTPLARWGAGPDEQSAAIRWLLLDFQVSLAPGETAWFFLQPGSRNPTVAPSIQLEEDGQALWVDTGTARFRIDKALGSLSLEGTALRLSAAAQDAGGKNYNISTVSSVRTSLAGTQRTAIEVKGSLTQADESLLDYTAHYWFYAGSGLVRLFFTIENNTLCPLGEYEQLLCHDIGSPGGVAFSDFSLRLETGFSGELVYRTAGENVLEGGLEDDLLLYQDSAGGDFWDVYLNWQDWESSHLDTAPRMQAYVSWRGYRITQGETLLNDGDHAGGWMSLSDGSSSWGVGVRDFWQNYPKALRANTDGTLEIGLFPGEFGKPDYRFNLRAGEHKTHELWLAPQEDLSTLLVPLFAQVAPQWYVDSAAFGLTALADWESWPEHEQYLIDQLDTAPSEGWDHVYDNLPDAIQRTGFYGIYDYGDWPIDYEGYHLAPLNAKYDYDYGMWLQWARSGDARWFALAEAADHHFADIDILHNLHQPRHWGDGITFGHSYHDEEGFLNPHRNYGGANPDTAYGMRGMLLTYYLTGYEKALQSALELADCIAFRVHNDALLCPYFATGECSGEGYVFFQDGLYDSNTRPVANSLSILTEAYRATGSPLYLEMADAIVDWICAEKQPYIHGPNGEEMYMKPWLLNMYLSALGNYLEMLQENERPDLYDGKETLLALADWLYEYAWLSLEALPDGGRAVYPYEWWFDARQGDPSDEWSGGNNVPSVNNWLLLGADAQAYAHRFSGNPQYLDRAAQLFRTGSHDPFYEGDTSLYTETKQSINSIAFGHIFLHQWAER